MVETEEELTRAQDERGRHQRRHSYSEAMGEKNAIVEPGELTRRQSVVARWNNQNSKKLLTAKESHDSMSSSSSSSPSMRPGRSQSVTRTPSSLATSRSSSINEIELPEMFLPQPGKLVKSRFSSTDMRTECTCRKDSLSSISARDSFSSYSIKRQGSGYSVSTCQSTLPPSSAKNSVTTLNAWHDGKLYQLPTGATNSRTSLRRHSDQTFLPRYYKHNQRRLSDQSPIRHNIADGVIVRSVPAPNNQRNKVIPARYHVQPTAHKPPSHERQNPIRGNPRARRPSLARQDSDASVESSRRDSLAPVTPKMLRRRFSEQLILEGGFGNEPEFDDLVGDENDPEESLTVANARKKVTLKRHYYPEGNWGYVVTAVAVIIHSICHGLQMGSGVLVQPAITRFDKKLSDAGKAKFSLLENM